MWSLNCRLSSRFRLELTTKYVSLAAILEAEEKEMEEAPLEKMGLTPSEPTEVTVEQLFFPPVGKMAEILKGNPEEVVGKLTEIIKKKKG
jgi:electron transfer flavoprotein alpha/beta subunit